MLQLVCFQTVKCCTIPALASALEAETDKFATERVIAERAQHS